MRKFLFGVMGCLAALNLSGTSAMNLQPATPDADKIPNSAVAELLELAQQVDIKDPLSSYGKPH